MNTYAKFLSALFFFMAINSLAFGQMVRIEAEGPIFNLPEVEAIIAKQDGKIQVLFTHAGMRMAKYKDVDLKTSDEIFMANGKKVQSVEELQEIYDKLEIGDILKIAIKRDEDTKIISIVKADPKDLPKRKMKMKEVSPEEMKDTGKEQKSTKVIMKRESKKDE